MTRRHPHPHAAFDRFPQLVADLTEEFGAEGIGAVVERFIDAERADFYWDGRIAERPLGPYSGLGEEENEGERVAILGYFRSRYYVATCIIDAGRRVLLMTRTRHFDEFSTAEEAFAASD
jgi:hypothetical protein